MASGMFHNNNKAKGKGALQHRWNRQMTDIMMSALLEEVARDGKKADNNIKKESMQAAVVAVNRALNMNIDGENVRSRYKTLKKEYILVKSLMEASGFGFTFDNDNNLVVSEDKEAFDRYVEAYPEAKSVRGKRFPYYEAMSILVGNEFAIGVGNNGGEDSLLERSNGQNKIGERISQVNGSSSADSESNDGSPLCICMCLYCKEQRDMALKNM